MPKGIALTPHELLNRRRDIAGAAMKLILERGLQDTSMCEIAQAAGMGKSSLYDYFKSKDEIIVFAIEEATARLIERARAIAQLELPPEERLRQIMLMHLRFLQADKSLLWRLTTEAQRLRPESQKRIQEKRYAYQDLVRSIIEEGIAQGRFRRVNALNAARLLINSLLSVLYTTRPTGSEEQMLDEAVQIFLEGVLA